GEEAQGYLREERPDPGGCGGRVHPRSGRGRRAQPPLRLPQRHVHDVHPEVPGGRDRPGHGLRHRGRRARQRPAPHLHRQPALRCGPRRL
ncbi:MAG: soluble [2Fe-2S] ferredoxin, partial [uncultured Rubrobacteraceae bacterium]